VRIPSKVELVALGVLLILVGWLGWHLKPQPASQFRDVIVHDQEIVKETPDSVLKLIDRLRLAVKKPSLIAHGDVADPSRLDAFCRPPAPPDTVLVTVADRGDSVAAPLTAPVAVLPPSSGKYDGKRLQLFSVTSDGKLFQQDTPAQAPFEWIAVGGEYSVREERAPFRFFSSLPGNVLKMLVIGGTGYVIGAVTN